ncbi:MAG: threonine--tRNA ligase [Deltaproteobacteria bacterium]|nr:threonine--tRNA ligase [Candidatus Anaeroferrophillacea bacterium]
MLTVVVPGHESFTIEPPAGRPLAEIVAARDSRLLKDIVAARIADRLFDLAAPAPVTGEVELVYADSPAGLDILRHSAAHVMAAAVKELFPETKVTIGPAIADGFFYDFDRSQPFTPDDLEQIEKRMKELVKKNAPFTRRELDRDEALELFAALGEDYKLELIRDLPAGETLSTYQVDEFVDLCRGPHIPRTGLLKGGFKLLSLAGAYWRGDEKNKMLQRIYGTAFPDKEALKHHIEMLEEAKRRDHRKLGRELDLFSIDDEVGAGFVIWHPKGAMLRTLLEDFERREHLRRGYEIVIGPQILKQELWKRSGHFDHYRENMYFTRIEEQEYGIKPMNCLAHMLIYKSKVRSYRDLPQRYFELGTVYRHEKSGVLHGLLRVRGFTQDDAHIICTPDQLQEEITGVLGFVADVMEIFGFPFSLELSTRPEKSIGSDEDWARATTALTKALDSHGLEYDINAGDGAFYGPKIDVKLKDALNREWQCATVQCDFTLPERFELTYVGADGARHRPVMLHRVILGSIERFIGVLIEHYAGAFPLWLAPVQTRVMTVTEEHVPYAREVAEILRAADIRVETDYRNEKLGYKIREAQVEKVPYMLVIGGQEVEHRTVTPRLREGGANLEPMTAAEFAARVRDECQRQMRKGATHSH